MKKNAVKTKKIQVLFIPSVCGLIEQNDYFTGLIQQLGIPLQQWRISKTNPHPASEVVIVAIIADNRCLIIETPLAA